MKAEAWLSEWNTDRNRVPAALTDDDNDLALAVLILSEAAIKAFFFPIGGLHVAAKVSAVDFSRLAFPPTMRPLHFLCHGFA
jgi:hypothetical protein